ncbi:MAG: ATP-binding cassette domain-containing protein, partial [Desulfobacterales bacterium]|nr:ATP-binding cassette domain-containing protein [Desulfobacterales bacterium]
FGAKRAVDDVSFTVEKGEILGFLGPNAAGKSTTMRMITGYLPSSDGTAVIGGCDIIDNSLAAREKIGYLPENAPVYPDMTVFDYLDFIAKVRGFSGADRKKKIAETIEKCFLTDATFQTVSTLSKGFKQRVCFAQSILHDPEYLILDEPTDGLDPNQKHEVRLMIRKMSAEKAIILSTHILDEVDAVCTRAIIIADGRIVADETPAQLRARSKDHGAVFLTFPAMEPEGIVSSLEEMDGVKSVEVLDRENALNIRVYPEQVNAAAAEGVMSLMRSNNFPLESIFVEQGRLDEVFRDITGA